VEQDETGNAEMFWTRPYEARQVSIMPSSKCLTDSIGHHDSLLVKFDVMDANDVNSSRNTEAVNNRGTDFPAVHGLVEDLSDETLSRSPHQNRPVQAMQHLDIANDGQVVVDVLSKSHTRVHDDLFAIDTTMDSELDSLLDESDHFRKKGSVGRVPLHGFGSSLHVHQDNGSARFRCQGHHLFVEPKRTDVVYDIRTRLKGVSSDLGLGGVY
jgi:hypothetical protein